MSVLTHAFHQWSNRPADERFKSLAELRAACAEWKGLGVERKSVPLGSLRVEADGDDLVIVGRGNVPSKMTHWAFGQLCSEIQAPAGYLRGLPTTLAMTNVNHGLKKVDVGVSNPSKLTKRKLLFASNGEHLLRSLTSDTYGRIWNVDVVDRLIRLTQSSPCWQPAPAAFDGSRGLYASDHDCFAFMVDNERRIFEKQEGGLGRGFFIWNSEVGATSFGMTTFLYEYVCGNHRVWGAQDVRSFKIPHMAHANDRAFRLIEASLRAFAESSPAEDERKIEAAHRLELGANKEEVVEAVFTMKKRPQALTQTVIEQAFDVAEKKAHLYGPPTTAWGFTGGLTEVARDLPHTDERVKLDRAASKILEMAF